MLSSDERGCDGVFMGGGTNCDGVNCSTLTSGACCLSDHTCTITTPSGCSGSYLGDGSNCGPPDPCPGTPSCGCGAGFTAFDGSGRLFQQATITSSYTCGFGAHVNMSATAIATLDCSGCVIVTCSGAQTGDGGGNDPFYIGGPLHNLVSFFPGSGGCSSCGNNGTYGVPACGALISQSATEQKYGAPFGCSGSGCVITLSIECVPAP